MIEASPEAALREIAERLRLLRVPFAVVGGIAVSVRGEVRFTRDVDVAIVVPDDATLESLVRDLSAAGFVPGVIVEQERIGRIATVRMRSRVGVVVDLLAASSGIEREIVERAAEVSVEGAGRVPVAAAEELLAMKVLAMAPNRLQDRIDALGLVAVNVDLDLARVKADLAAIRERGFDRGEDLEAKLEEILREARAVQ